MEYTCKHCKTPINAGKEHIIVTKGEAFHEKCFGLKAQISIFELMETEKNV